MMRLSLKVTQLIHAFYHQTTMPLRDKGQEGHDLAQYLQDVLVAIATKITVKQRSTAFSSFSEIIVEIN